MLRLTDPSLVLFGPVMCLPDGATRAATAPLRARQVRGARSGMIVFLVATLAIWLSARITVS